MKMKVRLDTAQYPPRLELSVFDAPHRRMHDATIVAYRKELHAAGIEAGIDMPIEIPIDLDVIYIDPTSPDFGNLYLALERALDGSTMRNHPTILADDGLISKLIQRKLYRDPYRLDERGRVRRKSKRHGR